WYSLIEEIIKRNLFISQVGQDDQFWLRYHHLFRDFLHNKMRREREEESRKILTSLADEYQLNKDWDLAFDLYQQIGVIEKMISLVANCGSMLVTAGKFLTLKKWLDALPPEVVTVEPVFVSLKGAILVNQGEVTQGILLFSEVVERLLGTEDDIEILLLSIIRRAVSHRIVGNYPRSHEDSCTALEILENYPQYSQLRAEALRNLGLTYYYQGDFKEALNVLKQSLHIFESFKDQENIPIILFNIALLHKVLGDYDLAETMYQKANDYWHSGANLAWLADNANNLGMLQQLRGDFCSAAANFEKAIEYSQISNSRRAEGISMTSLGDLYRDLDAYNEALDVYKKARLIGEQLNDGFLLFYLDLAEGVLYNISGDLKKSTNFFNLASQKAKESGSLYNFNLLETELAMSYLLAGKYEQALKSAKTAYEYFEKEGQKNESLRAAFCCALALIGSGDASSALSYLRKISPVLLEDKYATPLTLQARYVKDILNATKGNREAKNIAAHVLERVNIFENNLIINRKRIRQQAKIIPFEPPRLIIQSFGKSQVFLRDNLVTNSDWQTQNARELFYLFLAHPGGLTKEQVGLFFWPDASPDELKLRFKNALYRLRRALGGETIVLEEDYYKFNLALDYDYDVEHFQRNIDSANKIIDIPRKLDYFQKAVDVYQGEYLPEFDCTWVIAPRMRYQQMYIEALMQMANLAMDEMDYKTALQHCNKALSEDPCLEAAHRLAMQIHSVNGNRVAIVRQFENCVAALSREINVPPSRQTSELY
ncbi:MAG TPA: tetratricopeptide repeat protein, partial [Caldithrix sp.]|nr:tetratricopeptide repeat protein [Caldithrix sp.]